MLFKTSRPFLANTLLAFSALALLHVPSAEAQQAGGVALFQPTSQWNVGATQLSTTGFKGLRAPCVLSTEYNNGYIVRFSGGGDEMLALAIDFRQDVFTQGRKYDAMLALGNSYVKQVNATAFTASTLIFNLRPLKEFYGLVKRGGTMELNIDSNDMKFSLSGIGDAIPSLEKCYAGKDTPVVEPMVNARAHSASTGTSALRPVKVPGVETAPLPQSFDDIVQGADTEQGGIPLTPMDVAPMPVVAANAAGNVAPSMRGKTIPPRVSRVDDGMTAMPGQPLVPAAANVSGVRWIARAGEDIHAVLSRWADAAGYDVDWQTAQDGKVVQDVSLNGDFEQAVSQLLAENAAVTGVAAHVEKDGAVKPLIDSGMPSAAAGSFSAQAGASMQSVLSQWSAREGVELVWNNPSNLSVKSTVRNVASFEEAVQQLLDQYSNDSQRPVGTLNRNPDNGRRTLTIGADNAG